jgi:Ca2+-binding EF-hand superfamily protein
LVAWALVNPGAAVAAEADRSSAMARYDLNRDGVLSLAEKEAYKQEILRRMASTRAAVLKKHDLNGNGRLDPDEQAAYREARAKQRARSEARALGKFDADGNGTLDPAEQAVRQQQRETWIAGKRAQALQVFDANKNGVLDPSEKATMTQRAEEARAVAVEAYDKNADGRVDPQERANASAADLEKVIEARKPRRVLKAEIGGEAVSSDGTARLVIQPAALTVDGASVGVAASGETRDGTRRILKIYHAHWTGPALKKPATLTVSYADVASAVKPSSLVIGRWVTDAWQEVGGAVGPENQRVSVEITEQGRYALMERTSFTAAAAVLSDLRVGPSSGKSFVDGADIRFRLAAPAGVRVKIYDTAGRHIRSLADGQTMGDGEHVMQWDGRSKEGRGVSSGLYIVELEGPANRLTKKLLFVR